MSVDLSALWARDARGYVAYYADIGTGLGNVYRITSRPYGKTGKLWQLRVNGHDVAFMAGGTARRLMDLKRRAQEIENGAEWRPEDPK